MDKKKHSTGSLKKGFSIAISLTIAIKSSQLTVGAEEYDEGD